MSRHMLRHDAAGTHATTSLIITTVIDRPSPSFLDATVTPTLRLSSPSIVAIDYYVYVISRQRFAVTFDYAAAARLL